MQPTNSGTDAGARGERASGASENVASTVEARRLACQASPTRRRKPASSSSTPASAAPPTRWSRSVTL